MILHYKITQIFNIVDFNRRAVILMAARDRCDRCFIGRAAISSLLTDSRISVFLYGCITDFTTLYFYDFTAHLKYRKTVLQFIPVEITQP